MSYTLYYNNKNQQFLDIQARTAKKSRQHEFIANPKGYYLHITLHIADHGIFRLTQSDKPNYTSSSLKPEGLAYEEAGFFFFSKGPSQ